MAGFSKHPHTGFEAITLVERDYVDHFDSFNSSGRYAAYDLQWLSTSNGVEHCEISHCYIKIKKIHLNLFKFDLTHLQMKKSKMPTIK